MKMKGFKPTGFGPSAGFKFPASMGFTGSTGGVTNVAPYVRRKAFADGGFVRQDNPRMKAETIGDSGSALVRRSKPTTQLDQESGGRTPLRPGYKRGGRTKRLAGGGAAQMIGRMREAPSGADAAPMAPAGHGPLSSLITRAKAAQKNAPMPAIGAVKGKFYEGGGKVVRGSSSKGFWSDLENVPASIWAGLKAIPDAATEGVKSLAKREAKSSNGMAKKAADRISGRQKQIDDYVTRTETGYRRGGKVHADAAQDKPMMRMTAKKTAKAVCKADGGIIKGQPAVVKLKPGERMPVMRERVGKAHADWGTAERDAASDKRPLRDRLTPM